MTNYPNTQIPKEVLKSKSETVRSGAVYFGENQVKFFRFLPDGLRAFAEGGNGFHNHSEKEFRFSSFLFTVTDFLFEFLFRNSVVCFAIVSANAGSGSYQLTDQSLSDGILGNTSREFDHRFTEERRPLLQIIRFLFGC